MRRIEVVVAWLEGRVAGDAALWTDGVVLSSGEQAIGRRDRHGTVSVTPPGVRETRRVRQHRRLLQDVLAARLENQNGR